MSNYFFSAVSHTGTKQVAAVPIKKPTPTERLATIMKCMCDRQEEQQTQLIDQMNKISHASTKTLLEYEESKGKRTAARREDDAGKGVIYQSIN